MSEIEALEDCPFCGSDAVLISNTTKTLIKCPNDQCISSGAYNNYGHKADAITAWNTRADHATDKAIIAELGAENARLGRELNTAECKVALLKQDLVDQRDPEWRARFEEIAGANVARLYDELTAKHAEIATQAATIARLEARVAALRVALDEIAGLENWSSHNSIIARRALSADASHE